MLAIGAVLVGVIVGRIATLNGALGPLVGVLAGLAAIWCWRTSRRLDHLERLADGRIYAAAPHAVAEPATHRAAGLERQPVSGGPTPSQPVRDSTAPAVVRQSDPAPVLARPSAGKPSAPTATQTAGFSLVVLARTWLSTGNVPAKGGVVLSLFGVAFLIKEAVDRNWLSLPIEARLLGVALFGFAMLAFGWQLRQRRSDYAVSLQGGGIAILHPTAYVSYSLYGLIAPVAALRKSLHTLRRCSG